MMMMFYNTCFLSLLILFVLRCHILHNYSCDYVLQYPVLNFLSEIYANISVKIVDICCRLCRMFLFAIHRGFIGQVVLTVNRILYD